MLQPILNEDADDVDYDSAGSEKSDYSDEEEDVFEGNDKVTKWVLAKLSLE